MDYQTFFQGKRVIVLGLGLLGRGVGDVEFIASHGAAKVIVTDKKSQEELKESIDRISEYPHVEFVGGHDAVDFSDADMVIKAAGVPLDSPEITAARNAGVPVYMSTALAAAFAREVGALVVGITGTRGKSTVTQMIYHTLSLAGVHAHVGGNIRGISTLELVSHIEKGDVLVLELDSWQLQGFGDLALSPQVAVFTNLMPDHQNYYPSMETYFADKKHIYAHQKEGDVLITNLATQNAWIHEERARIVTPFVGPLKVIGEHNRENAALAAEALRALGLSEERIAIGLSSFEPVEGRLQLVHEESRLRIFNDNNATTPEATIAALAALQPIKPVLIIGGSDKGLASVATLAKIIPDSVQSVVFLKGTGTDILKSLVISDLSEKKISWSEFDQLEGAINAAITAASGGGTILFSPAFASFGMFKNEYDRNDQFMKIVQSI